jgi:hypothetical protein
MFDERRGKKLLTSSGDDREWNDKEPRPWIKRAHRDCAPSAKIAIGPDDQNYFNVNFWPQAQSLASSLARRMAP